MRQAFNDQALDREEAQKRLDVIVRAHQVLIVDVMDRREIVAGTEGETQAGLERYVARGVERARRDMMEERTNGEGRRRVTWAV